MPSVRLTNSDRNRVVRKLLEPMEGKIRGVKDECVALVCEFLKENTPTDVWEMFERYPDVFANEDSTDFLLFYKKEDDPDLYNGFRIRSSYISLPDPICYHDYAGTGMYFSEAFMKSKQWKKFDKAARKFSSLERDRKQLKNMLECKLDEITTLAKLKAEFPEAYAAYWNGSSVDDACTSTETVRAKLASLTK